MNGEFLKARLKEKGMAATELSRAIGLSKSAASQWICGKCNPSKEHLEKTAEILECNINELMGVIDTDNDLKRNGSGYIDPTASEALTNIVKEDVEFKQGEIWEYRMSNGEVKYALIISADECANGRFRNIIILNEEQKGIINVPMVCRGMKYADCGMVSYGICNRFENFVRQIKEDELQEVQNGIAKALGLVIGETGKNLLAERWQERYKKTKEKLFEVEKELAETKMTVDSMVQDIDTAYRENARLKEKLTLLESQPVFPPDTDEVVRLKTQVEMLEKQNEKLLDRLIG